MDSRIILMIAVCFGLFLLILSEINYYRKGWGLNFHLIDADDGDAWVKPFPKKVERAWLLVAILAKTSILTVLLGAVLMSVYRMNV